MNTELLNYICVPILVLPVDLLGYKNSILCNVARQSNSVGRPSSYSVFNLLKLGFGRDWARSTYKNCHELSLFWPKSYWITFSLFKKME